MFLPSSFMQLGSIRLSYYGLVIAAAVVIGYFLALRRVKLYGLSVTVIDDLLVPVVVCAIIGARLYHVIDHWAYYQLHPKEIIMIWHGGIGIFGALVAGLLPIIYYAKIRQISLLQLSDILSPCVLLGQAIGRWGNFFNQEAFGPPTNLPWKIFIDIWHRPPIWLGYSYFQPLFLYEFLWDGIGAVMLLLLTRRLKARAGFLTAFYLLIFGTGRLLVEQFRFDTAVVGGVKLANIISLCLIIAGIFLLGKSKKKIAPE